CTYFWSLECCALSFVASFVLEWCGHSWPSACRGLSHAMSIGSVAAFSTPLHCVSLVAYTVESDTCLCSGLKDFSYSSVLVCLSIHSDVVHQVEERVFATIRFG